MKNIFVIALFSLLLFSCETPENEVSKIDLVPVGEVMMPTRFAKDSITEIEVTYTRPTSCHIFTDFYYKIEGNERTVALYCAKLNQDNCTTDVPYPTTVPLRFKPAALGTYHFKFWTGVDEQNIDQFIEYDAVVNH